MTAVSRRSGHLAGPSPSPSMLGAGTSDHACWGYLSGGERAAMATAWLHDGLRAGQRALYVGDASSDALLADLASMSDVGVAVDAAVASGTLVVQPAAAVYDVGAPIDASRQLAMYDAAVRQAIDDGYRGLRVAADITPLVADPALRSAHQRWEQLADRYIVEHPLAPLCLYDRGRIDGIDAIVCVHALQGPHEPLFAVFADGPASAAIDGQVDACVAGTFADVLAGLPGTDERLDLSGLAFFDGHAASVLHDELTRRAAAGQRIALDGVPPAVQRVWELCGFSAIARGRA